MRIVHGVQSTGKGHLSRFLGLLPLYLRDGHEVLVFASGYEDPPEYFLEAVADCRYVRFRGISYVGDGVGGVSKRGTCSAFLRYLPELLASFGRAQDIISDFAPHLMVSDFDPISGSAFVAPAITKVGLSHQNILLSKGMYHPPRMQMEKFFTYAVLNIFTGGLTHRLGCHFYPGNEDCLPPIIRPAVRNARTENRRHIVVYHTLRGMLAQIERYASDHPDRPIIVYGYPERPDAGNIHFESDRAKFASDLATADSYVGTAGFQSISEAFYLGKKIVVQPIVGQYEQIWNAAQLEHHGMGRWLRDEVALEDALEQRFNGELHRRLHPWFRDGAQTCYERLMSLAQAG